MKKIAFSMAVSLLFILLVSAPVLASPAPVGPGPEKAPLAIGRYEISVFKNGRWQDAGTLTYDKHLREKQIDSDDRKGRVADNEQVGGAREADGSASVRGGLEDGSDFLAVVINNRASTADCSRRPGNMGCGREKLADIPKIAATGRRLHSPCAAGGTLGPVPNLALLQP